MSDPSWVAELPEIVVVPRVGADMLVDLPIQPTRELTGTVAGVTREVLERGLLLATLKQGPDVVLTTVVDDSGGFAFSRVRPGHYALSISGLPNAKTVVQSIDLAPTGGDLHANVRVDSGAKTL